MVTGIEFYLDASFFFLVEIFIKLSRFAVAHNENRRVRAKMARTANFAVTA